MWLKKLKVEDFRNIERAEVDFDAGINVLCGNNAQGKTNMLEAVYFLAGARSFRTRSDRDLIGFGKEAAYLTGEAENAEGEKTIEARLVRGSRKRLLVNGVKLKSSAELFGTLRCVLFRPEDLELVRSGAAFRRRFMDMCIAQLRPRYAALLTEYERVLEHKGRILRDWEEHPSLLETLPDFSERLVRLGAELIVYRAAWCAKMGVLTKKIHGEISGGAEELQMEYATVKGVDAREKKARDIYPALLEHMEKHRQAELASGMCLSGPHKDDIILNIDGNAARSFASQGQARTAALSLKLAARQLCLEDTGEYPIMLLDDVLSELDPVRRDFVLNRISGGQVIITCCEDELSKKTGGRLIAVEKGRFRG